MGTSGLDRQVAVITGGANGIGRATAERFLQEGARVVIADMNDHNAAAVLAEAEKAGHGGRLRFVHTDVSREDDVRAMIQCALDEFGRLDCLFNNAGIGGAFGPISETTVEEWDFTTGVLLRGVFLGMKHASRIMKAQGEGGVIISTTSVAGLGGGGGSHCYSAAKAAVVNLTRCVASELAPDRIRVNTVAPGPLMTELFHRGDEARAAKNIQSFQPWPEPGTARDVAGVVAFLASDDARLVTGETILVDGGILAKGPALWGFGRDSAMLKVAGLDKGTTGEERILRPVESP